MRSSSCCFHRFDLIACAIPLCAVLYLTGSVGSHDSAARGGRDVERDRVVEDEHVGLGLVRESDVDGVDERDVAGGQALGVLQRHSGGESELALQSDLLLVVLLAPLLLVMLLTSQEGGGVHVLVLDEELFDLLIALLVLSGLCTKETNKDTEKMGGAVRKCGSMERG